MTWTKTGAEYVSNCAAVELSDAAYRTHPGVISWIYENERMDCRITKHRVSKEAESPNLESATRELVAVGFWRDAGDEYEVIHHADVIRASITAQNLKKSRDKKAAQSYRNRQVKDPSEGDPVSADVSAAVSGDADRQTDKHAVRKTGSKAKCEHGVVTEFWTCVKCDERKSA